MSEPKLFEEMLATYPAEKRELARAVYHRFADGDSAQFFTQLLLVLDVYGHYTTNIPSRMIAANADTLATMQEIREEVVILAKTIETRDVNITNHAVKTDELCKLMRVKCNETISSVNQIVKNLGSQVDTQAIAKGLETSLNSGLRREVLTPFTRQIEHLAQEVLPTLEQIRSASAEATKSWSRQIWKTAWTTTIVWSSSAAIILSSVFCLKFCSFYDHKLAAKLADMSRVLNHNRDAFRQLAIAQRAITVIPATDDDGTPNGQKFVLVIPGADAAEMHPLNGKNSGCIFFKSQVPFLRARFPPNKFHDSNPPRKTWSIQPTTRHHKLPPGFPRTTPKRRQKNSDGVLVTRPR